MSLHDHACLESVDGQAVTLLGARLTGELRGLLFAARRKGDARCDARLWTLDRQLAAMAERFQVAFSAIQP